MHTAAPGRHCMQVRRDPATVPSAGPAPFHRLVAGGKAIAGGPRVWYGVKASSQARDAPGPPLSGSPRDLAQLPATVPEPEDVAGAASPVRTALDSAPS